MLKIQLTLYPDSQQWDKSGGTIIRTIDLKEASGHWDTGTYRARVYTIGGRSTPQESWIQNYVGPIPYKDFSHEKLAYLALKRYLKDHDDLPD